MFQLSRLLYPLCCVITHYVAPDEVKMVLGEVKYSYISTYYQCLNHIPLPVTKKLWDLLRLGNFPSGYFLIPTKVKIDDFQDWLSIMEFKTRSTKKFDVGTDIKTFFWGLIF